MVKRDISGAIKTDGGDIEICVLHVALAEFMRWQARFWVRLFDLIVISFI